MILIDTCRRLPALLRFAARTPLVQDCVTVKTALFVNTQRHMCDMRDKIYTKTETAQGSHFPAAVSVLFF